jgi:hypothetical protein
MNIERYTTYICYCSIGPHIELSKLENGDICYYKDIAPLLERINELETLLTLKSKSEFVGKK